MANFRFLEDKSFVKKIEVLEYFKTGDSRYFKLKVYFIDSSELYAREYISETERNYSFHWQYKNGNLIRRWDNAPHHKEIKTYPHHLHTPEKVLESHSITFDEIIDYIEAFFIK